RAIVHVGAALRRAVEDGIGETFDLELVAVGVLAQRPMVLAIGYGEALHFAGLVEPGDKHLAVDRALLAVDGEAFRPVAAHGHGQIQVADTAVGKLHRHEPAVSAELLYQPSLDTGDLAA